MIKKVKIFEDLPIEEGKTYITRFATGDLFFVKKVIKVKDRIIRYDGIYHKCSHLGICPLAVDRLIPEKILVGEKIVIEGKEFDITPLLKSAFEAGQNDKGNNWYGGDVNQYLQTIK